LEKCIVGKGENDMSQSKTKSNQAKANRGKSDIAIVGLSCRFPGANDYHEFWNNLANGVSSIREIPPERWDSNRYYCRDGKEPHKSVSKWCGLLDDIDRFDHRFFNISPREANNMDPQQRLLLEETWRCIEDSGIPLAKLQNLATAVFVGVMGVDYLQESAHPDVKTDSYACLGNYECILANRISYWFNLKGSSYSINAACASSLVALHEAKRSLAARESDFALAGGVNLNIHPWKYVSFSQSRMLSPDGQCKPFDKDANGYVPGDGVGVLLLQRLDDAVRDGNHIYGILKGAAVNHCGKSVSITAPRAEAQCEVILAACRDAGLSADSVGYIEAHGSGTSLGDPIEIEGLTQAFQRSSRRRNFCKVGSVKSNIGHLEAAAGIAGVIKVLLMFGNQKIAPTLNIKEPNPIIDFAGSPFAIADAMTDWRSEPGLPLRAGVSSFGFGGVNSHVILEEYCPVASTPASASTDNILFLLSANSPESLKALTATWRAWVKSAAFDSARLTDICLTLATGRKAFPLRYGALVKNGEELREYLRAGDPPVEKTGPHPWCLRIAGLNRDQSVRIHQGLLKFTVFQRNLEQIWAKLKRVDAGERPDDFPPPPAAELPSDLYSFMISYALIQGIIDLGFAPDMIVPETAGIHTALVIAGMLPLEDALALLRAKKDWTQVRLLRPAIPFFDPASRQTWLPYRLDAAYLQSLLRDLQLTEAYTKHYLEKARNLHSYQYTFKRFMEEWDPVLAGRGVTVKRLLDGDWTPDGPAPDPNLLLMIIIVSSLKKVNQKWDLTEHPVEHDPRFTEIVDLVIDDVLTKASVVEWVSPNPADPDAIAVTVNRRQAGVDGGKPYHFLKSHSKNLQEITDCSQWIGTLSAAPPPGSLLENYAWFNPGPDADLPAGLKVDLRIGADCAADIQAALLELWLRNIDIRWEELYAGVSFQKLPLPVYPFQGSSFWLSREAPRTDRVRLHPLLDANTSTLEEQCYTTVIEGDRFYIKDHVVGGRPLLPGVVYLEMARAAGENAGNRTVRKINNIIWSRAVELEGASGREIHISLRPAAGFVDYQVWSAGEAEPRLAHSQGKLYYDTPVAPPEFLDYVSLKTRCNRWRTKADCYGLLERSGYRYGPGLQAVYQFGSNEREALAVLRLPDAVVDDFDRFVLHPAIMDGALQSAMLFLADLQADGDRLYLPFSLGELEIGGGTASKCFCHITLEGSLAGHPELGKLNISIADEQGRILVKLRKLTVRASQAPALPVPAPEDRELYFTHQWIPEPLHPAALPGDGPGPLLLFADDAALVEWVQASAGAKTSRVVAVQPGHGFRQSGPDQFVIDPARPEDYRQLLQGISASGKAPRHILHCWSRSRFGTAEPELQLQLERSLFSLVYLTQALLAEEPPEPVRLLYVYQDRDGGTQPQYAAMGGFIQTVNLESKKVFYKSVALDGAIETAAQAESLLAELASDGAAEIRYAAGQRWINSLLEFDWEKPPGDTPAPLFKTGGVYWITGGTGGLGLILAKWIAGQVQATLVLTGRSALTAERERAIEALRASGSEAVYFQADISRRAAAERVLQKIKARYREINGIIHCAGVIRDSFLARKTREELSEVLAAKVRGTIYVDELTAAEPLDFMVLSGSIVGWVGNPGQCDYAYANRFLAHYGELRENLARQGQRRGKTLTVSWPLWRDGGMRVGKETETLLFKRLGMKPLRTETGLDALSRGLAGPVPHYLVVEGDSGRIRKALGALESPRPADGTVRSGEAALSAGADLMGRIGMDLKTGVARILELAVEEIDLSAKMSEFGFDSVSYTQFSNWLNELYNVSVMPSAFFEYPTLELFAGQLAREYREELIRFYQVEVKMEDLTAALEATAPVSGPSQPGSRFTVPGSVSGERTETAVAIIGMSGILPQSDDLDEFWDNLVAGRDLISTIPAERWDWRLVYGDPAQEPNKTNVRWGGFMRGIDRFDPLFFGIAPRDAELMDPQHRIFLETVWRTIEDAGYKASELAGTRTGLFVGVATADYNDLLVAKEVDLQAQTPTGVFHSVLANRISYLLDFHGPSEPVDTACSSSLVAVHKAVEAIQSGGCELAIAGGVNAILTPSLHIAFGKAGMLCEDGRCKTFDQDADGYARGEGCGAILLKPLAQALEDGDHIYAVIKGTGVNHGGRTPSLTAPNPNAQADLVYDVWQKAGIDPGSVGYLETHGTGTALGDPIEINGLKKAFGRLYEKWGKAAPATPHCGLGSVKTNIGHLEAAAGIAGIFKVLLALKYGMIPRILHFQALNPYIGLQGSPFFITRENMAWEHFRDDRGNPLPRRAGVSSFGFGGVNAHVVLEEYPAMVAPERIDDCRERIYIFSARNEERLKAYIEKMITAFTGGHNPHSAEASLLNDYYQGELSALPPGAGAAAANGEPSRIAYTLQVGREALEERLAVVAADLHELVGKLSRYYQGETEIDKLFRGNARDDKETKAVFKGAEGEARLRRMIADQSWAELARQWVRGAEVNWKWLYQKPVQRLSLPTYPFARERYWLPQSARPQSQNGPTIVADGPLYYETCWKARALTGPGLAGALTKVLIFDPRQKTYEAIREKLAGKVRCGWVIPGERYQRRAAGVYEINPQHFQDYQRLLAELDQESQLPDGLVYLGASPKLPSDKRGGPEYAEAVFHREVGPIFHLIQALQANQMNSLKRLLLVSEVETLHSEPAGGITAGYCGSLGLVWPDLSVKSLMIQGDPGTAAGAEIIATELMSGDAESEIRYHNGVRLVKRVQSLDLQATEPLPLVDRGVYLITGGAGGLGLIFAEYLAENYRARLVLIGRSPLNESIEAKLRTLRALGGEARYLSADVCDPSAMESVVGMVKERCGGLNGVIHSAGSLGNQTVLEKASADFAATLKPKITGTLVLDQATQNEPLDFFMVFSSVAAHLGDFGQCDYAIANRFLDHYVVYRETKRRDRERRGRTIGINWPLWKEGGMHFNPEAETLYLQTSGMSYLETGAGIKAFEAILQSGRAQVMVFAGARASVDRILRIGTPPGLPEALSSGAAAPERLRPDTGGRAEVSLEKRLTADLRRMAAALVKLSVEKIDIRRNLGEFGFDSIGLKEYAHEIKTGYHIAVSPTLFFAHSSIESIGAYLLKEYAQEIGEYYSQSVAENPMRECGAAPANAGESPERLRETDRKEPPPQERQSGAKEPVAIIGISGVFPGSRDVTEFWDNLEQGRDLISEIPKERWDYRKYYGDPVTGKNVSHSKWGGFIADVDKFDAAFFSISPREAELMDPQHRLFVETVWKAIEDAGYKASGLSGRNIGVFAGVQFQDYQNLMGMVELQAQMATGNFHALLSNRISYLFNFRGPSESIDTACSSSLVAVHRAVKSLQNGESELAVAGGVNLMLSPATFVVAGKLGILSPDGRCKTFDKDANGYVRGEGVGALLLKPLSKAVRDRDPIYAVIRGTAENHGGRANSLTAPNPEAQAAMLVAAYREAACDIRTVTYIETHGTGTELGDPVEVEGLKMAFGELAGAAAGTDVPGPYSGLGSVKTNIGHLEPAAGIAGLIKVVLAMQHRKLPGILHLKELNPYLELEQSPFYVVKENQPWQRLRDEHGAEIPLRAGVSSFGFGGTNAHVVLEEYQPPAQAEAGVAQPQLVVLSAKNGERLREYAGAIIAYLEHPRSGGVSLRDLAFTLNTGREELEERLAVVVSDLEELKERLTGYYHQQTVPAGLYHGNIKRSQAGGGPAIVLDPAEPIGERQLHRLGELWVSGAGFDWERLYCHDAPQRVSLPTYPFERRSYWFDSFKRRELGNYPGADAEYAGATGRAGDVKLVKTPPQYHGNAVALKIVDETIGLVIIEDRSNANMFTPDVLNGLSARFAEIGQNPQIKTVIVTGYDNVFCMGGTRDFLTDVANRETQCSSVPFVYEGLLQCPVPVIAAIQGHAYGGGLIFGLFADIIVMAEEGVYSANFTKYGFTPGVGSTLILREKLGNLLATEMMFTAKSFSGAELKSRGASPLFCKQGEVVSEALAIARGLSEKPLKTLRTLKRELSGRILAQLPAVLESEVRMHDAVFTELDVNSLIQYHFTTRSPAPEDGGIRPRRTGQTAHSAAGVAMPEVQDGIVKIVAQILHMESEAIDAQATFKDLGIDSISGVEVIRDLNAAFRLNLEVVTLYDCVTIYELSRLIESEITRRQFPEGAALSGVASPADPDREYRLSGYRQVKPKNRDGHPAGGGPSLTEGETAVQAGIVTIIANILHMQAREIDAQAAFRDLGVDSISGVEIVRDINRTFRLNCEVALLYDYPSPAELSRYLSEKIGDRFRSLRDLMPDRSAAVVRSVSGSSGRIALKTKANPDTAGAPASRSVAPKNSPKVVLQERDGDAILQLLQRLSTEELDLNEVDRSLEEIL
jgi:acyl transferase domain-containing protein/enoyl-CoA hydratase/carnithine racemase/acyl carrier protein